MDCTAIGNGETIITPIEDLESWKLTNFKLEALRKRTRINSRTGLAGDPTLATMGVGSDCYGFRIIDVEFYKSGQKQGEIKTIKAVRWSTTGDRTFERSYIHNDRFYSPELNGRRCVDVQIFKSYWSKDGEFKFFGQGKLQSYVKQLSIGRASTDLCREF
jgi:hypothetical protein